MQNETSHAQIQTTGDLRTFLCELLSKIESGRADLDSARTMVKVAAQINESFYSEIKIAAVQMDAGKTSPNLGDLRIGSGVKVGEK